MTPTNVPFRRRKVDLDAFGQLIWDDTRSDLNGGTITGLVRGPLLDKVRADLALKTASWSDLPVEVKQKIINILPELYFIESI